MLSILSKASICQVGMKRIVSSSVFRFFANAKEAEKVEEPKVEKSAEQPSEKSTSKKNMELPDFPEFPFIRTDFEAGIRNRDYLKNRPTQKRVDLLKQKPGSIVYFDDEEFAHYFPHEYYIWIMLSCSFYAGFEKQKELTQMNTMQVRQEALNIMNKLQGSRFSLSIIH